MLKILKDCRICGVSVHAGEIFPACDFKESDIQVVIGAGFAERFTPPVEPDELEDSIPEEPEDFTVSPVKQTAKKTASKKKSRK